MSPKVGKLQKKTWKMQPLNLMYLSAQKIFWKMTVGISFSNTSLFQVKLQQMIVLMLIFFLKINYLDANKVQIY
jgi:hypothetical protein